MLRLIFLSILGAIPAVADVVSCSDPNPTTLCRGVDGRTYQVFELRGTPGDPVYAADINDNGWIIGSTIIAGTIPTPALWKPTSDALDDTLFRWYEMWWAAYVSFGLDL